MKRPDLTVILVCLVILTGLVVGGLFVRRASEPARMEYTSFLVVSDPPALIAGAKRVSAEDCANGLQADIRDTKGEVIRLPVPARKIEGDVSTYPLVIPEGTAPGMFDLQIRETFTCQNKGTDVIESPWLPLVVR